MLNKIEINNVNISFFLKLEEDSGKLDTPFITDKSQSFQRRKQIITLTDSPIVIFSFDRKISEEKYVKKMIVPEEKIKLLSGRELEFTSVTVYVGYHYICYFKCNNEWYEYNDYKTDNENLVFKIGKYDNLDFKKIGTQGTQFFYM
jgi:hypothetical protein